MKILIYPIKNIRTGVPIYVTIEDAQAPVRISNSSLGKIPLFAAGNSWKGQFWVMSPGTYPLRVQDARGNIQTVIVQVNEQTYLPFHLEFGIFSLLLTISFIGVYLWYQRQIKKNCI